MTITIYDSNYFNDQSKQEIFLHRWSILSLESKVKKKLAVI
jgi:hypothetical protein